MQDPNENISAIPQRLREVIEGSGLSQAKFALFIDEDLQRLKDVLRGQLRPPTGMIQKVIERCGVDAMWLLSGRTLDIGELSATEKILVENYRSLSVEEMGVMTRVIAQLAAAKYDAAKADKGSTKRGAK